MDSNNTTENNKTQEMLNALADGQLPAREREEILSLIDKEPKLSDEVCEIYRIKDLVKTAYPLDDFPTKRKQCLYPSLVFLLK